MANNERINFTLSNKALKALKKIPAGQRSKYIDELIIKDIKSNDLAEFIEKYKKRNKPIWTDENHPDLMTEEDIANYRPLKWKKIEEW
ncbi:MAG: hypothetical protein HYY52_07025 [Candidatus Melainabacteria bacterium]|nr:hypothetical protein [Candidatus Melainabacteria bacterium]